ncbi:armadillo repeat-containing protein 5 [Mantella aurantiaca]
MSSLVQILVNTEDNLSSLPCAVSSLVQILVNMEDNLYLSPPVGAVSSLVQILVNMEDNLSSLPCRRRVVLGAVSSLVQILLKTEDGGCLQSCLRALRILGDSLPHRLSISQQGGVARCVGMLTSGDPDVVCAAVRAVCELSRGCSLDCAEQISPGVPALMALASGEGVKGAVRQAAFGTLCNLCNQGAMRPMLGNAGFIKLLITEVTSLQDSATRCLPALRALCLCCREAVNRLRVRELGGLDLLLDLLHRSPYRSAHHRITMAFLHYCHDNAAMSLLSQGGLAPLLAERLEECVQSIAPHRDCVQSIAPHRDCVQSIAPHRDCVQSIAPHRDCVQSIAPHRDCVQSIAPHRDCVQSIAPHQDCVQSIAPHRDCVQSIAPHRDCVQSIAPHRDCVQSIAPHRDCVQSIAPHRDCVQSIAPHRDCVQSVAPHRDCVQSVAPHRDCVQSVAPHRDCVQSIAPHRDCVQSVAPHRDCVQSVAPHRDCVQSIAPHRDCVQSIAPHRDCVQSIAPHRDCVQSIALHEEEDHKGSTSFDFPAEPRNRKEQGGSEESLRSWLLSEGYISSLEDLSPEWIMDQEKGEGSPPGRDSRFLEKRPQMPGQHCLSPSCGQPMVSPMQEILSSPSLVDPRSSAPSEVYGPEFPDLLLLSRFSQLSDPASCLVSSPVIKGLLTYITCHPNPSTRAARLLQRLSCDPLCLEAFIRTGSICALRARLLLNESPGGESKGRSPHPQRARALGHILLRNLCIQAESPFGVGLVTHMLVSGLQNDRIQCALCLPFIYRKDSPHRCNLLDGAIRLVLEPLMLSMDPVYFFHASQCLSSILTPESSPGPPPVSPPGPPPVSPPGPPPVSPPGPPPVSPPGPPPVSPPGPPPVSPPGPPPVSPPGPPPVSPPGPPPVSPPGPPPVSPPGPPPVSPPGPPPVSPPGPPPVSPPGPPPVSPPGPPPVSPPGPPPVSPPGPPPVSPPGPPPVSPPGPPPVSSPSLASCSYWDLVSLHRGDLVFVLDGGEELEGSRDLVSRSSEVFHAMLQGGYAESRQREVRVREVPACAFLPLLHYLHGCARHSLCPTLQRLCQVERDQEISQSPLASTLAAAGRFLLPGLQCLLENTVRDSLLNLHSLASVYNFAATHECSRLRRDCCVYLLKRPHPPNRRAHALHQLCDQAEDKRQLFRHLEDVLQGRD